MLKCRWRLRVSYETISCEITCCGGNVLDLTTNMYICIGDSRICRKDIIRSTNLSMLHSLFQGNFVSLLHSRDFFNAALVRKMQCVAIMWLIGYRCDSSVYLIRVSVRTFLHHLCDFAFASMLLSCIGDSLLVDWIRFHNLRQSNLSCLMW